MKRLTITLTAGALALLSCGISSGEVVDKAYQPGYVIAHPGHYSSRCSMYDSKGRCKMRTRYWVSGWTQWVPDNWKMWLRNGDDTGWTSVSYHTWQNCTVGQRYNEGVCSNG